MWGYLSLLSFSLRVNFIAPKFFIIAGKNSLTYRDIVNLILRALGKRRIVVHVPIRMSYVTQEEIGFNNELLYKIDSIAQHAITEKATPGCQILIAKEGKIFFNRSYGYHTYNKKTKVKNEDVYDLASITKIAALDDSISSNQTRIKELAKSGHLV